MPGKFTFYTTSIQGDQALFDENETRHAIGTLRYQAGQLISFTDGKGNRYEGEITGIEKRQFAARILERNQVPGMPSFSVICGIIKSTDRMEWMMEKCTELGVSGLYFFNGKNSERNRLNLERMEKIAIAALKQSHGAWLPSIGLLNWNEVLQFNADNRWYARVDETHSANWQKALANSGSHLLVIGPEGDLSASESEELKAAGFSAVGLGPLVLRTETAVMASAAAYYLSHSE